MAEGRDIVKWVDDAMYEAQPILGADEEGVRLRPRVFLINATPDPLGTLAVDMRMYRGDPVYDLSEITDEERKWAWNELSRTKLNTPLEGVQVKFMIEAVTRSFTHQMVRQRVGAYYVQESLRFAVKRGLAKETAYPPSIISDGPHMDAASAIWHDTIEAIEKAYNQLVDAGIPAEDARGLLPHAVTTRILYTTNLRSLFEHAGMRLCTQAQFEWRAVFMGIMQAMREYSSNTKVGTSDAHWLEGEDAWQWKLIGTPAPKTFSPACYHEGKCAFMASLDRGCTIRDRVQTFAQHGVPPEMWGDRDINWGEGMSAIDPHEWMSDPTAGITTEDNQRPPE